MGFLKIGLFFLLEIGCFVSNYGPTFIIYMRFCPFIFLDPTEPFGRGVPIQLRIEERNFFK